MNYDAEGLWPSWRNRIKLGDLVRFSDEKRAQAAERVEKYPETMGHLSHIFEIGLVVETTGLNPVISFPSGNNKNIATDNLEVA